MVSFRTSITLIGFTDDKYMEIFVSSLLSVWIYN